MTKVELEKSLEARCVAKVEAAGGLALKLQIPGVRGFADRTCMFGDRKVFFLEFKRTKGGIISKQQHRCRTLLFGLGFNTYFVDSNQTFAQAMLKEGIVG